MTEYFNLTTEGLGYLSQIDLKPIDGRESIWLCQIAALRGSTDNAKYTWFTCRVVGEKAIELCQRLQSSSEAKQKILVRFVLSDLNAVPFQYQSGKSKGQPGVHLNARLLKLRWVRIGQDEVYREQPKLTPAQNKLPQQPARVGG
ncbi:MAG: DUF3577 domain-containing protein [Gammaproteobacteria bacterium]|nr:DUF3577 domain-containing protein [Gammaproteobacteria bacterium]